MSEQKENSRRNFLKYAVTGVAGVAIGAAAGYGMAPGGVVPTVEKTTTVTEAATTVTGAAPAGWVPPPPHAGAKTLVAVTDFTELTEDAFGAAIDEQIELLGGWQKFETLVDGKKVAMKTICHNCTPMEDPLGNVPYPLDDLEKWKPPWPTKGASVANVHPLMAKAMAKRLNKAGAAEISFCEGNDAGGSMAFDYEVGGFKYHLADLPYLKAVEIDHEMCHMVDTPNALDKPTYAMPDVLYKHTVVSLSQIKTHYGGSNYDQFTSGIKSWIGIQPAGWCGGGSGGQPVYSKASRATYDTISYAEKFYGDSWNPKYPKQAMNAQIFQKGRAHSSATNDWNALNTVPPHAGGVGSGGTCSAEIADLHSIVHADFHIADASSATEGTGCHLTWPGYDPRNQPPNSGRYPLRVNMKERTGFYYLIGGYDVVANDSVTVQVMGWHPIDEIVFGPVAEIGGGLRTLYFAKKKGLGEIDPRMIDVKGQDTLPNAHFERPRLGDYQPYPLPFDAWGKEFYPKLHPDFERLSPPAET